MTPHQNSCFGLMVTGVVTNSPGAGLSSRTLREGLGQHRPLRSQTWVGQQVERVDNVSKKVMVNERTNEP